MKFVYCLFLFIERTLSRAVDTEKVEFCRSLECKQLSAKSVCGLRQEGEGFRLKLFENECELLQYGCQVKDEHAYGIINLKYCMQTFTNSRRHYSKAVNEIYRETSNDISGNSCNNLSCAHISANNLCCIRRDGQGFKIRLFFNECELSKYNCENKMDFHITDLRICKGMHRSDELMDDNKPSAITTEIEDASRNIEQYSASNIVEITNEDTLPHQKSNEPTEDDSPNVETTSLNVVEINNKEVLPENDSNEPAEVDNRVLGDTSTNTLIETTVPYETDMPIDYGDLTTNSITSTEGVKYINDVPVPKNIIVLDGGMVNFNGNINETMDNFFAATHIFDLPVREVNKEAEILQDSFRRMQMRIIGPVKVFKPWIVIPNNISTDVYHQPTLSSCYHKCPTVCPDTYAPVCGVPGIVAREPSLMFKNHCFMDAAQCKMSWDDKSETAESSSYIESSFMICLGDNLNGLYRFLPLIRTLQHMGRLKSKGKFHYKLRNMRFFNQYLAREPKPMG